MIRHELNGIVYTIEVTIERDVKSCANMEDFSTYDRLTDCYAWRCFDDAMYLVIPNRIKENIIRVTVYLQVNMRQSNGQIRHVVRSLFEREFFPTLCGASIVDIGRPRFMLNPLEFGHNVDESPKYNSERILYMITHFK